MTRQTIQSLFEKKYCEENEIAPAELAKSRWMSQDGYNLPRVNRAYRYFRDGYLAAVQAQLTFAEENIELAERLSGGCAVTLGPEEHDFIAEVIAEDNAKRAIRPMQAETADTKLKAALVAEFNDTAIADRVMRVIKGERG